MQRLLRVYGRGAPVSRLRECCFSIPEAVRIVSSPSINKRYSPGPGTCAFDDPKFRRWTDDGRASGSSARNRYLLALSTAAALPLATTNGNGDDVEDDVELTLEQSLLGTSEEERLDQAYGVNKDRSIFYRFFRRIKVAFIWYIYEPIATGLRFLQLVIIFVPVFATIPVIFLGSRNPDADNERTGTLWWYRFLVKQMERAGPTFIKVVTLVTPLIA